MAARYWVSKAGGWSGPTGAGTEASPYLGMLGVRAALGTGILPNDTVIMMGEYGPVLHAELLADFPNTAVAINAPLTAPGFGATTWGITQGGCVLGDRYDGTSNCRDITFEFRGTIPWHIDARGATTNAGRMRAALCINGVRNKVKNLRLAAPDWNWIDTTRGGGQFVPSTGILYPGESSFENHGLVMNGGWGCQVTNGTFWGSDAFGQNALYLRFVFLDTTSQPGSQSILAGNTCYGSYYGLYVGVDEINYNGGLSFPARYTPGAGAALYVRNNTLGTARWGDRLTTPVVNNAMQHAGQLSVQSIIWTTGPAKISGNTLYGDCQDSMEIISAGFDIFDNEIRDICPLYSGGANYTRWYDNAGTWATQVQVAIGEGLKLGLISYDGSIPGATWPSLGIVSSAAFGIPATRNRAFRNRIHDIATGGRAIIPNGANGHIVHGNEMYNIAAGIAISNLSGTDEYQGWFSNNYISLRSGGIGFDARSRMNLWLYNNIINAPSGTPISTFNATATTTLRGGNNRLVSGAISLGAFGVNSMTGNTTGTADYTVGVGPTAGGNCAAAGSWQGIIGARAQATLRAMDRNPWRTGRLAVGPYRGV